jgi:hypothetical protein
MRSGSRSVIRVLLLLLVFAGIFPFVYPLKDGKPLLSLDQLTMPKIPDVSLPNVSLPLSEDKPAATPVTVYKWQDAEGNWHFSNEPPPAGIPYESSEVDPNANLIQGVNSSPAATAEETQSKRNSDKTDKEVVFGYTPEKVGEMMEKTRNVKKALEQRQQAEQEMME